MIRKSGNKLRTNLKTFPKMWSLSKHDECYAYRIWKEDFEKELNELYSRCKKESVEACYEKPECRFCDDPYVCTVPLILREILKDE